MGNRRLAPSAPGRGSGIEGAGRAIVARLAELLHREREAMAEFLMHLAEFDRAQGWRELGYAGLFPFLERELGSESGAFFRMKAAQLLQEHPEIVEPLRDGRLCLSTMAELAKVLRPGNRETVLPRFFHRSKQQARMVAAELAPVQDPPVRAVAKSLSQSPADQARRPFVPETPSQTVLPGEPTQGACAVSLPEAPAPDALPRDGTVPMTGELNRLHVTVSRAFLDKLEAGRRSEQYARGVAGRRRVGLGNRRLAPPRPGRGWPAVARERPLPR